MESAFEEEYKKLNKAQKEAVDTIDGPVMVVAGPGTGKTQVLSLRIANILKKTDIKANGILCLTFTNSGVSAMKERLERYIGKAGLEVDIYTFHSFGMKIIEKHFKALHLSTPPKLLDNAETAIFFDEILHTHDWQYLRPRGDSTRYFSDLKSLISLLSRERITSEYFLTEIEKEIKFLEKDEDSISTRGESKGQIKKEIAKKIEGLERSKEIVKFIEIYEKTKKEKNLFDYDDVLSNLVKIVETSEDVLADIREQHLYVLIDEHQDSSRVQNEFLQKVWGEVEKPDIFVVGDDRQLIYGFSGASIEHFEGFKKTFKDSKLIPLVDNYRSTQVILDTAHALLRSVMSEEKLVSQSKEHHPIRLVEAETGSEEIFAAALDIQNKIKEGVNPDDCAILVPKNKQVRDALETLHRLHLPVSSLEALNLFDQEEALALLRVLKIISNTEDEHSLALSFFDKPSGINPILAHKFMTGQNMREFSFKKLLEQQSPTLFNDGIDVQNWIQKLSKWRKDSEKNDLPSLVTIVGKELLTDDALEVKLVSNEEILNTVLAHLILLSEKNPNITLAEFVSHLERLESYGEHIPIVTEVKEGVKVLTLHSSKGLEFDYVWIAHMDEKSLTSGKKMGFTLPPSIAERVEERDIDAVKRKLYVAITRAKRFCTLSYALESGGGSEQEVARVIADLPPEVFEKQKVSGKANKEKGEAKNNYLLEVAKLVPQKYTDRYVSVSLLNNFFECSWKWYFQNLLQLPTPPIESLEFGIAVHASIDRVLKMKNIPTPEEVEKITIEEVLNRKYGDERARVRMGREVQNVVSRWVKNRLPEIKLSRKTEESISIKNENFPHLKIYGKIDLIENLGDKEVRVTDFKTGSVRKRSDIEKLDEEERMSGNLRQLAMYSYLLAYNPKWKADVRESRLEFLEAKNPKEAFYDRVISKEEINFLLKDIADYDNLVKSGEWLARPCNYNSYGKNTECEYCKLAEIYR